MGINRLGCTAQCLIYLSFYLLLSFPAHSSPVLPGVKKLQDQLIKNNQQDALTDNLVDELDIEPQQQQKQLAGDIKFRLTGITITGNTLLQKEDVQGLIQSVINSDIDGADLKRLAEQVTEILHSKGYKSSRAFVPPQQIKGGKVEIKIEEDKLGAIQVLGEDSFKYNEALFYQYFADLRGKIIHTPTLIERLKYLNFLPATRIKPQLKKIEFGQSALILVLEPVEDTTALSVNNNASRLQGDLRTVFSSLITNPTGRGDSLNVILAINPEFPKYYSSVAGRYSVPFGDKGAKLSVNYSELSYQIDPEALGFTLFIVTGESKSLSIEYEKPFMLDWGNNSWSFGLERRYAASQETNNFDNEHGNLFLDQSETIYGLSAASQFIFSDQLFGDSLPAQNLFKVKFTKIMEGFLDGLTQEQIDFKEAEDLTPELPQTGPVGDTRDATANFWKLYVNYARRQILPYKLNLHFQFNGEYADFDNIPTSYDYGGADSGTSGYDWRLSVSRNFTFDNYLDWLSAEVGVEERVAFNVFMPPANQPLLRSVNSCGGLTDLNAFEIYRCDTFSPYLSLRAKSDNHVLWLRHQTNKDSFELTEEKTTLSYTYVF